MRQTIIPLLTASSLVLALGCGGQKKPEPAKEAPAKAEAKDAPQAREQPPPKPPPPMPEDDEEELPDDPGEDNKAAKPEGEEDEDDDATGGVE